MAAETTAGAAVVLAAAAAADVMVVAAVCATIATRLRCFALDECVTRSAAVLQCTLHTVHGCKARAVEFMLRSTPRERVTQRWVERSEARGTEGTGELNVVAQASKQQAKRTGRDPPQKGARSLSLSLSLSLSRPASSRSYYTEGPTHPRRFGVRQTGHKLVMKCNRPQKF